MSLRPCRLLLLCACAVLPAALRADEPDLRLAASGRDVRVDILPSPALPDPLHWNLYRGALADAVLSLQHGDPDGRCAVDGAETGILLSGERDVPGDHYYLLTARPAAGPETGLGAWSDGTPRINTFPCPAPADPCGTELLPLASIRGTEGLAIAPDGTTYYSQSGAVGRRLPGMAVENRWVALPGATTVWGIALRSDGMLFVGSPTAGGNVFRIDTTAPTPVAELLYAAAGSANGLAIAPDGRIAYGDFNGGRVYLVDDAGTRVQVTASAITQANGLLFDDDGTLLVLAYGAGQVWRLSLDASLRETSRVLAGSVAGARLDGIAKDVSGRYYLSDNSGGRLIRTDSSFGSQEVLLTGVSAAANIAFGKGALDCLDVHVASSGNLGFFEADVTGRP